MVCLVVTRQAISFTRWLMFGGGFVNGVILRGDGASFALQRLAREQTKHKLLTDIRFDLGVCSVEGWDHREYLRDLHRLIAHFDPCEARDG